MIREMLTKLIKGNLCVHWIQIIFLYNILNDSRGKVREKRKHNLNLRMIHGRAMLIGMCIRNRLPKALFADRAMLITKFRALKKMDGGEEKRWIEVEKNDFWASYQCLKLQVCIIRPRIRMQALVAVSRFFEKSSFTQILLSKMNIHIMHCIS